MIFELDFSKNSLECVIDNLSQNKVPDWMAPHYNFLKSYNSFNEFEIQTSGTTGKPKIILVTKMQMQISATATRLGKPSILSSRTKTGGKKTRRTEI